MFRIFITSCWCAMYIFSSSLATVTLCTPGEANHYKSYTTQTEITEFLSVVDHVSPDIRVQVIGETLERDDLYMVVCGQGGIADSSKLTCLVFASQHGDEQSGKEAALWLIRDCATGELTPILQKINLLVVPLVNPNGSRLDKRLNEQNLDLNRDHVKLESPEIRALHRMFFEYLPEVTLDVHEMGEDYYLQQLGVVSNANIHPSLQNFSHQRVLPYIKEKLALRGITFHEYLIQERLDHQENAAMKETDANPRFFYRYSTTDINDGRNGFGIFNSLSFILEGASSGRVEDLAERTERQYWSIRALIQFMTENADTVRALVASARHHLQSDDALVHMRMHYVPDSNAPPLVLKSFDEPTKILKGTMKIDRKKGETVSLEDIQFEPPGHKRITARQVNDWRPKVEVTSSRSRPEAYVIPGERYDIIRLLLDHQVAVDVLAHDQEARCEVYKILDIDPATEDYSAPSMIKVEARQINLMLRRGTFVAPVKGFYRNLLPLLLEPLSSYGLIRYFKYKLVPPIDNYYPIYRTDELKELDRIPYERNW